MDKSATDEARVDSAGELDAEAYRTKSITELIADCQPGQAARLAVGAASVAWTGSPQGTFREDEANRIADALAARFCPDPTRHHEPTEALGRSRLLGDDGPLDGDDEDRAERALRMLELTNERADIDLERDKLAHAQMVASDGLRLEALHTAREIVRGYKFPSPTQHTRELAAQYRRLLGLLEEPDPANPTQDGQAD